MEKSHCFRELICRRPVRKVNLKFSSQPLAECRAVCVVGCSFKARSRALRVMVLALVVARSTLCAVKILDLVYVARSFSAIPLRAINLCHTKKLRRSSHPRGTTVRPKRCLRPKESAVPPSACRASDRTDENRYRSQQTHIKLVHSLVVSL